MIFCLTIHKYRPQAFFRKYPAPFTPPWLSPYHAAPKSRSSHLHRAQSQSASFKMSNIFQGAYLPLPRPQGLGTGCSACIRLALLSSGARALPCRPTPKASIFPTPGQRPAGSRLPVVRRLPAAGTSAAPHLISLRPLARSGPSASLASSLPPKDRFRVPPLKPTHSLPPGNATSLFHQPDTMLSPE